MTVGGLDADSFSRAFHAKTDGVRSSTAAAPPPAFVDPCDDCRLTVFEPVDTDTCLLYTSDAADE